MKRIIFATILILVGLILWKKMSYKPISQAKKVAGIQKESFRVTKISDKEFNCVAVGDGETVWAWNNFEKGVFLIDNHGNITNQSKPLLPNIMVKNIFPFGNGQQGFASAITGISNSIVNGLYVIGKNDVSSVESNILPEKFEIDEVRPTCDGIWIKEKNYDDSLYLSKIYFASNVKQKLSKKLGEISIGWKLKDFLEVKNKFLIAAGEYEERIVLLILDKEKGLKEITISNLITFRTLGRNFLSLGMGYPNYSMLNVRPPWGEYDPEKPQLIQMDIEDKFCLVPRFHYGLYLIDLIDLINHKSENEYYEPKNYFTDPSYQDARFWISPPNIIWFVRRPIDRDKGLPVFLPGIYCLDISKMNNESEAKLVKAVEDKEIAGLLPVDTSSCLIEIYESENTVTYYLSESGNINKIAGNFDLDTMLDCFFPATRKHLNDNSAYFDYLFFMDSGFLKSSFKYFNCRNRELMNWENELIQKPELFEDSQSKIWCRLEDTNARHRGITIYDLSGEGFSSELHSFFADEIQMPLFCPFGNGFNGIASLKNRGSWLVQISQSSIDLAAYLGDISFSIKNIVSPSKLDLPSVFYYNPNTQQPEVKLNDGERINPGSRIRIEIESEEDPDIIRIMESPELNKPTKCNLHVSAKENENNQIPLNSPCKVRLRFTDPLGTNIAREWSGIQFIDPYNFFEDPKALSVFAALILFLLSLAGAKLRGAWQRWLPLGLHFCGGAGGIIFGTGVLDRGVLLGLIGTFIIFVTISGSFSPEIFRELERIEPYRFFAPWAFSIGWIRRRLYSNYVKRLEDDIKLQKKNAHHEVYFEIPVYKKDVRGLALPDRCLSAIELLVRISSIRENERSYVLVESPGGRGKSALIREIALRAIDAFEKNPVLPLPVLCQGDGDNLFDRTIRYLGTDCFSPELLTLLLKSGEFFLVIDGITESSITPGMIQKHIADYGIQCPILMAGRPNKAFQGSLKTASRWIEVEPQRLDESNLKSFIECYGKNPAQFSDQLKQACRYENNEYLPILVRLALMIPEDKASSIQELYRIAVHDCFLNCDDGNFDSAISLCMETYWLDGNRKLKFSHAKEDRKVIVKNLLDAGLLVPASTILIRNTEPETVKFFHDSIQSYLTAVGLDREKEKLKMLLRTAGDDIFAQDHSDLFDGSGSELFKMCLLVFEPKHELEEYLKMELLRYSDQFSGAFSRDWVVKAALPMNLSEIDAKTRGYKALRSAIEACSNSADIRYMGNLYAEVVRFLWGDLKESSAETPFKGEVV